MATRPTVTIASPEGKPSGSTHPLPEVFKAPIRPDVVQYEARDCQSPESMLIGLQDRPFRYGEEQAPAICRE